MIWDFSLLILGVLGSVIEADESPTEIHNTSKPPVQNSKAKRRGTSARTTKYRFGERYPTTGRNQRPERWWEPGPGIVWTHRPGSQSRRIAENRKKTRQATQPNWTKPHKILAKQLVTNACKNSWEAIRPPWVLGEMERHGKQPNTPEL